MSCPDLPISKIAVNDNATFGKVGGLVSRMSDRFCPILS